MATCPAIVYHYIARKPLPDAPSSTVAPIQHHATISHGGLVPPSYTYILEGMDNSTWSGFKMRYIKSLFTEDNMVSIGCGITFAALFIQFIIVSTN